MDIGFKSLVVGRDKSRLRSQVWCRRWQRAESLFLLHPGQWNGWKRAARTQVADMAACDEPKNVTDGLLRGETPLVDNLKKDALPPFIRCDQVLLNLTDHTRQSPHPSYERCHQATMVVIQPSAYGRTSPFRIASPSETVWKFLILGDFTAVDRSCTQGL